MTKPKNDQTPDKTYTIASLFSGAGGLDLGFKQVAELLKDVPDLLGM